MLVHLLTEVVATGSEVENQVEVLSDSLEERHVQFVAHVGIFLDDVAHLFHVGQLIDLFLSILVFFTFLAADQSTLRLLELCIDVDKSSKHVMTSGNL